MSTKEHAVRALAGCVGAELDGDSRAEELAGVTLPTIGSAELSAALVDIGAGDGGELLSKVLDDSRTQRPKLHSAYSSCGLALNTFGPWRLDPSSLSVAGRGGFTELRFERQLRIFKGGRAPNLDLVLTAPGRVPAIESKLTEHLGRKPPASFSGAYERLRSTRHPSWWAIYESLRREPQGFKYSTRRSS